ncbi:hypothetical protein [Georgenia sp. SUBG003]|uniref:hypothetical protein n=1 Tax=Georgenia sp. SUBG003 TaxID=1497974 RepID=UPI003AB16652
MLPQGAAEQGRRDVLLVALLDEDVDERVPDLLPGLVVGRAGVGRRERLGPVPRAEPEVEPVGLDRHPLGGRFLVQTDGRLDGLHHLRGRLQAGHLRVGLGRRRSPLGDEIPQGAGPHTLLAEAGQHVRDIDQVGLVRTDHQHAAVAGEAGLGVEQVGRAVQGDDGLAGARTAVDDQRPAGTRADDRVLVRLDRAEDVPHPRRAAGTEAGDERGLVVGRGAAGEPVRDEHLVPVVDDPSARPAVPAAAREPHGPGAGRAEERLGGR